MRPKHYCDIGLLAGMGIEVPILASEVMAALHVAMARSPGTYALDFPQMRVAVKGRGATDFNQATPGAVIRIFAETKEAIDEIADYLEGTPRVSGYINVGRSRSVPDGFAGPYVACVRYRIPSANTARQTTDARKEKQLRIRENRLNTLRMLPWIGVVSASNGQAFRLTMQRETVRSLPTDTAQGAPDGYGLSRTSSVVYLPAI